MYKLLLVRTFGTIDLVYLLWLLVVSITQGQIPIYDNFVSAWNAADAFEHWTMRIAPVLGLTVTLSLFLSGVLMLLGKKAGVWIALAQAPFRLTLVAPPTFFFLAGQAWLGLAGSAVIMIGLEVVKIILLVRWLRLPPIDDDRLQALKD